MIIPIELRFKADKDSKSAFRTDKTIKSHDVNSVEFHISIDGLELTDNYTAKILSVFHSSESQANVDCEIVEGKIIYKPDTNLISRHEHVTNYVYVYNGNQSLDVREFIYVVDLSKIDETSLEVKEVYDQSYADLLADFEQALSDYKDNLPQADSVRAEIDGILTQFGVDSQAKLSQYDTDAQQVITDNQTAFGLAESGRQDSYEQAESDRNQASNQAIVDWNLTADSLLETVEDNETARVDAEATRKTAETDRVSSETTRKSNETTRISNESERESAEDIRIANEAERVNAETQRKTDHANRSAELAGKADKVVLRNEIKNGDFSDGLTNWTVENGTASLENGKVKIATNGKFGTQRIYQNWVNIPINHMSYFFYTLDEITNYSTRTMQMYSGSGSYSTNNNVIKLGLNSFIGVNNTSVGKLRYTIAYTQPGINPVEGSEYFTISNAGFIDLTATFGAGNEPAKEEMDEIIKLTGYIDGEYALNNKEMLSHLMKGIREKANKKQEDWITVPLFNGVQHGKSPLKVMKDEMGVVHFKGSLTNLVTGSKAFTLPIGYYPDIGVTESIIRIPVALQSAGGMTVIQINYVGDGYAANLSASHVTYFDGVSYIAKRG